MDLRVFGTVHLIYLAITVPLSVIESITIAIGTAAQE